MPHTVRDPSPTKSKIKEIAFGLFVAGMIYGIVLAQGLKSLRNEYHQEKK